jgi:hypothetical protein
MMNGMVKVELLFSFVWVSLMHSPGSVKSWYRNEHDGHFYDRLMRGRRGGENPRGKSETEIIKLGNYLKHIYILILVSPCPWSKSFEGIFDFS